jgi:Uma2 family endonuclease
MPPRKTWTREELDQLERSGVLDSAEYELVDGELFKRMPKKWPHRFALAF